MKTLRICTTCLKWSLEWKNIPFTILLILCFLSLISRILLVIE